MFKVRDRVIITCSCCRDKYRGVQTIKEITDLGHYILDGIPSTFGSYAIRKDNSRKIDCEIKCRKESIK